MHEFVGNAQVLSERTIAMNAQHLNAGAAVGLALAAGDTCPAGEVGHHIDNITDDEVAGAVRLVDNPGELVAHDARIFEVRLIAGEDVQIGAA
ncbi:hypothetical protein D3C84_949400 [compost metagenome]